MISGKVMRVLFIPAATVVVETKKVSDTNKDLICKASELPLYPSKCPSSPIRTQEQPNVAEEFVGKIRKRVEVITVNGEKYFTLARGIAHQGMQQAEGIMKYLGEEDDPTPKYGAIAIGGVTGFILGIRGGIIRRAFYATLGAGGMATVCYPKEATQYYDMAMSEMNKYMTICYNFACGVKKDDASLTKLTSGATDWWGQVREFAKSPQDDETTIAVQKEPTEPDNPKSSKPTTFQ